MMRTMILTYDDTVVRGRTMESAKRNTVINDLIIRREHLLHLYSDAYSYDRCSLSILGNKLCAKSESSIGVT